ncbi:FAD-dependent oxidoreductase [Nocardia arthritidis]|uniref:D-amino-acid oxidase n=1 Tax=Nocardia arthritidis TaxID=228602 RepID=A0A6G9YDJ9_9NOCA|nr:FAD-dependent oxidoreductase [Nocardia arthritidis]QIS11210.1 FAD-dependent oxidoreductase [Nocardia arthritidis]
MANDVLVLGAGVIGLTTAVCLVEAGHRVRIWAERPPERTTSAVASGLWGPGYTPRDLAWSRVSLAEFSRLAGESGSGVHFERGLLASSLSSEPPDWVDELGDVRICSAEELPDGMVLGLWNTVPLIDLPCYLRYLVDRLAAAGVFVVQRTVRDLTEATSAAPIVVNCTGIGARALAGDDGVQPVRGQHVIVRNPGIDYFYYETIDSPEWAGFFPHGERLILGGIRQPGEWSLEPDPELADRILRRCIAVEPKLAEAEVLGHEVGLRPGRAEARLEIEHFGDARVVHNYGHDGLGVSLSWGSAREVTRLLA